MLKAILKRGVPLLVLAIILCGCWDSRDLEDRTIVTSVMVDKTEEGYAFYPVIAAVNAGKSSESGSSGQGGQTQFKLVHSQGKTIAKTREDLDSKLEEPAYLGAIQAVILSERLAKSGIEEYLLRLRQAPDYRKTLNVVVSMEDPVKLMEFKPKNQASVGFALESMIKHLVDTGETYKITLGMVLEILATPNNCFVLYTIGTGSNIELTGYSVFEKAKFKAFIPKEKGNAIVYFKSSDVHFEYQVPYREGRVTVRIRGVKKSIKPHYKDGKVSFDLSFDINAQVLYPEAGFKISEAEKQEITKNLQDKVLGELADAIKTSQQEIKCDYLDFYTIFRIAYPEEIKTVDWKKAYQNAEFRLKVSGALDLTSTIHYAED